jgi:tRNA pseudouridine13 synthase
LFNALLAERVFEASWERLLEGDLAILDGRGSFFAAELSDESIAGRCQRLEIHPSGPLWGVGTPASGAGVLELECRIGAHLAPESALCVAAGMQQERRALRLAVHGLSCAAEDTAAVLRFRLARGSFATAVLRELTADDADVPDA